MTAHEFSILYDKLRLPLGMFVLRIIGNTFAAEDIVQESFTRVWHNLKEGKEYTDIRVYLYAVARNCAYDWLRESARFTEMEGTADTPSMNIDEEDIDISERDAALWRVLEAMPSKRREVFLMAKRDGLSYKEIGEEAGISPKTVENHVAAAMKQLRGKCSGGFLDSRILVFF